MVQATALPRLHRVAMQQPQRRIFHVKTASLHHLPPLSANSAACRAPAVAQALVAVPQRRRCGRSLQWQQQRMRGNAWFRLIAVGPLSAVGRAPEKGILCHLRGLAAAKTAPTAALL